jgi:2-dehydropantoate 2-reductase
MKILIVGAGIIGTIYGWAFSEAGHAVTHFVRPGKAAQFTKGIQIDMFDRRNGHRKQFIGRYPFRVTETIEPASGYDLVVVPTKHYRLIETLKQIVPQTGQADYLLLTQNWDGTAEIDALLPQSRYLFGDAKAGGCFEKGVLIATLSRVDIGQVGNRQDACLTKALALFESADIPATVHTNILHYLWVQYALTGGLWPSLVRAGSIEVVLSNREISEQSQRAARECLEMLTLRGIDLKDYPEVRMYLTTSFIARLFARLVMTWMYRYNKYMQRCSAHALGDAEEIRVFFYDLLNTGRKLGAPMPTMSAYEPYIERFVLQAKQI